MRYTFIILFSLFAITCFSQTTDTLNTQLNHVSDSVFFICKLDIGNATKDGIYLCGYVVNIDYTTAKKLNGKKIRVTGKVTIIKGLKSLPPGDLRQGRENDTRHIESPKIEII